MKALRVQLPLLPLTKLKQTYVFLTERQRCRASTPVRRVQFPQSTLTNNLDIWVGSSVAERVLVKYLRVGSSPTRPSLLILRRSLCWSRK